MRRIALIFNPKAGKAETISDFLVGLPSEQRCEVFPVTEPEHIDRAFEEVEKQGVDRLIVAGGDGTFGRLVHCLAPSFPPIEIALLPVGTGNDLARSLGVSKLEDAIEAALNRPAIAVDAVRLKRGDCTSEDPTWFINVANGGMGGRVASETGSEEKKRWGPFAYWMQTASALADLEKYTCQLTLDGEQMSVQALGLAVANGRFVGGGFPMAGRARMDDGLLNVVCVPELPALDLVAAGVDFTLGRNRESERVLTFQARTVRVESDPAMPFSIDGELTECSDLEFEAQPGALRLVAAAEAPALGSQGEVSSLLPKLEAGALSPISALVPAALRG